MSLAARIASLSVKENKIEYKAVNLPENAADDLTLFESNSATKAATANEWTIDVFPDQIPLVTYALKLASQASAKTEQKDNSKVSLGTVCLYYVTIIQSFFLLNDLYIRPSPSAHAQSWQNNTNKAKFAEWLLSLPIPEPLEILLSQLCATQTDKTKNVFFIPTAAGFNLETFFGRFIPLSLFTAIHDCVATMPGNSSPSAIYADLLPRLICTIPTMHGKKSINVADILGYTVTSSGSGRTATVTATALSSKWHQAFEAIFNPVLFRDFHRRSSLATLDMNHVKFTAKKDINAYDLIFNATPHNLREMKVVLQTVASALNGSVPIKRNMSQFLQAQSGISAIVHGYSTYALPTWISNSDTSCTLFPTVTKITAEDPDARATALMFLSKPEDRDPQKDVEAATGTITGLKSVWSLIQAGAAEEHPLDNDFLIFDDETHTYPRVLVLDPTGDNKASAYLATLTGKIIETFELDGSSIQLPNVNKPLGMQNCQFFDSAIPYQYVFPSFKFRPTTTQITSPLRRKHTKTSTSLEAASFLHDRMTINLPHVATGSASVFKGKIVDDPAPTGFAGLTQKYYNWILYSQSFLSFASKINDATNEKDTIVHMNKERLFVWSPYTYTSYEDESHNSTSPDLTENRSYFLTNLRTLFGTDSPMYELVHPMEAMPV